MAPIAITPVSPPSPTMDTTSKLSKAGRENILSKTLSSSATRYQELDASLLDIIPTLNPRAIPAFDSPERSSGSYSTDHMLTCQWTESSGWAAPEIRPYGPLSIMPTASVLHYATECFEGLKAYRGYDGKVRLFRPNRNAQRFLNSSTRISLPGFSPEEFEKLLMKFVGVDAGKWIPSPGSFLYLRPTMIGTAAALGMQKPKEALMFVVAVLFPSYDESKIEVPHSLATNGTSVSMDHTNQNSIVHTQKSQISTDSPTGKVKLNGMRLLASSHDMIRAWPGGFGNAKVGANYGPSLLAQTEAKERGYTQILWLFGEECYVTEAGGSNFFVLWKSKSDPSQLELITAPLGDGVILEGITRASILDLVRSRMPEINIIERKFTMHEIIEADREGRLLEAFGAGTAVFVMSCADIHFRGLDLNLPMAEGIEPTYSLRIKGWLKDIMYGREENEWAAIVEEEQEQ